MNKFNYLLFISLGFFVLSSYASSCFKEHIQESLQINKERKLFYSRLTNGDSNAPFNRLILGEKAALLPAAAFDRMVEKYHDHGINIFCKEFMSMKRTPQLSHSRFKRPSLPIGTFDWKSYKGAIKDAIEDKDVERIRNVSLRALKKLKSSPQYFCMTRHLIESVYRFAYFLPQRVADAQRLSLKSPEKIIFGALKLQLIGLSGSYKIDLLSAPVQYRGVPMICSELPDLLKDLVHPELTNF